MAGRSHLQHVLIVEDHERNRALLKMLLEANGYRVTVAGDGVEALAAARRAPPDAIVSDVLLPKMDGFALCRAWMQAAGLRAIPFIFYSGIYVHPDDEQFAMALGAVRYLIKPVEAEVFLRELRAVLQQSAGRARSLRRRAPGVLRRKPLSLLAWRAGNRSLSNLRRIVLASSLADLSYAAIAHGAQIAYISQQGS